jgi:hypothetical protein
MRAFGFVCAFAGLVPGIVFADAGFPIEECEIGNAYFNTVDENPRDLGGGIVMYRSDAPYLKLGGLIVVACSSGVNLEITYSGDAEYIKIEQLVLSAAGSTEEVTLRDLYHRFDGIAETSLWRDSVEHCACAAVYPELRERKADWNQRFYHP